MTNNTKSRNISGAANMQALKAIQNQNAVLVAIARYGWLTKSQLSNATGIYPATLRHVINRMIKQKLIIVDTYPSSPAVKVYSLMRRGKNQLKQNDVQLNFDKVRAVTKGRHFINEFEHQYHRHLANEFLTSLMSERIEFSHYIPVAFRSEHELQARKIVTNSIFQCVPDSLAITSDGTLLVIEVENSCRGLSQHDGSLTHYLSVVAEHHEQNGSYSAELRNLFCLPYVKDRFPRFDNVEQVFICSSEAIYRNIWRKVEQLTDEFPSFRDNVTYFVLPNKKRWNNVFDGIEPIFHDEKESRSRVNNGMMLSKYSKDERMRIVNERYALNLTRSEVAEKHGVRVSTIGRWSREYKASI